MGQVVTELVVDADTSGADQFTQAMNNSQAAAAGATSSAASISLAIAGVGVGFVGALTALRGFVDYVGSVNKQLVDIADNANLAGMSTKEFQETLFAAKSSGVSDKDFVSGLDKIGADLTAASRGVTDFGKLFEANGVSIKDTNGQLITTKAALTDIAGLMANATPQVQAAIAKIVGLSADWIPFLKQGEDSIEAQKAAAASLGVVLDDSVIQKARDFNGQWQLAIATWDLQFKASLADILPLLIELANIASTIISTVGQVSSFFSRSLTPVDQMGSSDLNKQADAVADLADKMVGLNGVMTDFQKFRLQNAKGSLGLPEDADLKTLDAYQDKLQEMADEKAAPTRVVISGGSTVLPPTGGDANDAVDRAINTLQRHTEQTKADTDAVGLGAGALAAFRAQAAETSAVQANGGAITDEQKKKFDALIVSAGAAADALARAKVASDIQFAGGTAFLSANDVAIATQLKGIYGNDIPAALNSTYAASIRVNDAMKEIGTALDTNITSGLTDIVTGTKSVSQGFSEMGVAIVKALDQAIIKLLIVQPLMQSLQGGLSSLGLGGGVNPIAPGGVVPGAVGPTSVGGAPLIPGFASGTDSAPGGWSIVGENGPELMKVPAGSQILPNGGAPSGGGTQVNVSVQNYGNDNVSVNQRQNGNGGVDLEVMVGQAAASQMAKKGSALRQVTDNRSLLASR